MDPQVSGHNHWPQSKKIVCLRLDQLIGIEPGVEAIETSNYKQFPS